MQPRITLSDSAIVALKEGAQEAGSDRLRIAISEWFEYDLHFDRRAEGDIEVLVEGVVMLLDPESATRADGMSIDFGDTEPGSGFRIQNPSEPPKVKQLGAAELKAMMDRATSFELIDVRTEQERAIARIAGSRLLDERTHDYLLGLDRSTTLVFQCHHGIRSQSAAEYFLKQGFRKAYNLQGGIDAWSQLVDPSVPRY